MLKKFLLNDNLQALENRILVKYANGENIANVLKQRQKIINSFCIKNIDEILAYIRDFNINLTSSIRKMYRNAQKTYSLLETTHQNCTIEVTAKCLLDYIYPQNHPIQSENRQELWDMLIDEKNNPMYKYGVNGNLLILNKLKNPSFLEFIYLNSPTNNWNEWLDAEKTKNLHLIYPFHNLFEHTLFALTDFIFCDKFYYEINTQTISSTLL